MVHFFASMLLLVDAVVLVHRSSRDYTPGSAHLLVPRPLIRLYYGLFALLALVIGAGTATTGCGPPRRRRLGPAGRQAASRSRCATWPSSTRAWPSCSSASPSASSSALHMGDVPERVRRVGAHPHGGHGGPSRRRLHAVLHPPAGAAGRGPHHRRHRARDRGRADLPRLHVPRARGCCPPRWSATRRRRASPSVPIRLSSPCTGTDRPPSSSGLGHRPFTAAAPVRIRLGVPTVGGAHWARPPLSSTNSSKDEPRGPRLACADDRPPET